MPPRNGQLQAHPAFRTYIIERRSQGAAVFDLRRHEKRLLFDPVRQHAARRVRPKRRNARIVSVQHRRGTAAVQPLYQLALRSEEHTSELQSHSDLVCRLLLEKKKRPLDKTEQ